MVPQTTRAAGALLAVALAACAAPPWAEAPRALARPNHLAVVADGSVWVSDFQHDRLVHFGPDGAWLGEFGHNGLGTGAVWRVTAMAADGPDLVFANLRPESDESGADVLTELVRIRGGAEVSRVPLDDRALSAGARIDGLLPLGDAPGGHLLLVDSANGELVEIDADGRHVGRFGGVLPTDAAPHAIARRGDEVWVVEQKRHRLTVFEPGGRRRTFAPTDGPLRFPSAVAVCGDEVAVADFGSYRVRRLTLAGAPLATFSPAQAGPDRPVQLLDVSWSPDCSRLWVVDSKGDRVLATDPSGKLEIEIEAW